MKSLVVVFLAVTAVTAENLCTPGLMYKQDCNLCTCSDDGKTAACTDMFCPKLDKEQYCEPGKTFKLDECSTCTCSDDGTLARCTLEFCSLNNNNILDSNRHKFCEPGTTFNPDNCNSCKCSEDGTKAFCTLTMCANNELDAKPKQVCQPRSQFKDYCNSCFCSNDGLTYACTKMWCDPEIWNKNGTQKVNTRTHEAMSLGTNQVCTPLAQFKDFCNNCFCADDGSTYACTRMWCDPEIWNKDGTLKVSSKTHASAKLVTKKVCTPRSHFKNYCNSCFCSDDGSSYACTRMWCDPEVWNKDGSQKKQPNSHRVRRSVSAKVCTPNSHFQENCNSCVCSNDGLSKACTMMECDESNKVDSHKAMESRGEKVCEPGTTYSPDGCNTCVCNEYGTQSACTLKLCLTTLKQAYRVEASEKWGPAYHQGDLCTPGKSFYSECNRCVCLGNGRNAFCTLMGCQK